MRIKDIPTENRPRERLQSKGPEALSDAELLAIILKTGNKGENVIDMSNRLFSKYGLGKLAGCSLTELQEIRCRVRHQLLNPYCAGLTLMGLAMQRHAKFRHYLSWEDRQKEEKVSGSRGLAGVCEGGMGGDGRVWGVSHRKSASIKYHI